MEERFCKKCGKLIDPKKYKDKPIFCSIKCANQWKAVNVMKGKKYKKRSEVEKPFNGDYYKRGKEYCKNYDDNDLKCVVCYEKRDLDNQEKECAL